MPLKPLIMTLYRRPAYTRKVLDALARCDGIAEYDILFSCDFDPRYEEACQACVEIAGAWCASAKSVVVHHPKRGIDESKLWALERVFAEHPAPDDFVICLEDDMLPAQDFLRYMEWGSKTYAQNENVLSICGYNRSEEVRVEDLDKIWTDNCFHAWGWGMWRDRWQRYFDIGAKAYREYAGDEVNGRFDYYLTDMAKRDVLLTIKPVVARIQNFGEFEGEHTTPATYANDHNARGAWEMEVGEIAEWYESVNPPRP